MVLFKTKQTKTTIVMCTTDLLWKETHFNMLLANTQKSVLIYTVKLLLALSIFHSLEYHCILLIQKYLKFHLKTDFVSAVRAFKSRAKSMFINCVLKSKFVDSSSMSL